MNASDLCLIFLCSVKNTSAVAEHTNLKTEMSFDFNVTFVITEVYIFYTKIWFV